MGKKCIGPGDRTNAGCVPGRNSLEQKKKLAGFSICCYSPNRDHIIFSFTFHIRLNSMQYVLHLVAFARCSRGCGGSKQNHAKEEGRERKTSYFEWSRLILNSFTSSTWKAMMTNAIEKPFKQRDEICYTYIYGILMERQWTAIRTLYNAYEESSFMSLH